MHATETQKIMRQNTPELASPLADAIDDRIAETLDELLAERLGPSQQRRRRRNVGVFLLILAVPASALAWPRSPVAWAICSCMAIACLMIAWNGQRG